LESLNTPHRRGAKSAPPIDRQRHSWSLLLADCVCNIFGVSLWDNALGAGQPQNTHYLYSAGHKYASRAYVNFEHDSSNAPCALLTL
jgi:hypothetical protein